MWIQPSFSFAGGQLDARIEIFDAQGIASPLATYEADAVLVRSAPQVPRLEQGEEDANVVPLEHREGR